MDKGPFDALVRLAKEALMGDVRYQCTMEAAHARNHNAFIFLIKEARRQLEKEGKTPVWMPPEQHLKEEGK